MKFIVVILLLVSAKHSPLVAKKFKTQKAIIFFTTPEKSIHEIPISFDDLLKINIYNKTSLNNLKDKDRKKILNYSLKFNKRKGIPRTKKFRNDCSGFVRKVFYEAKRVELFKLPRNELRRIDGTWINGVELIWKYSKKHGRTFIRETPKLGDMVFFDNTHDRNKNKKYDDYFTHIGIVVKIDKDKTVHYIHKSNSGIKISKLNSKYKNNYKKDKKVINDFLRKKGKKRFAGQLLRGYASIYSKEKKPSPKLLVKKNKKKKVSKKNTRNTKLKVKEKNSSKVLVKETELKKKKKLKVQIIQSKYRNKIVKRAVYYIGKRVKKENFAEKVYNDLDFGVLDKEFLNEEYKEKAIFWSIKKNGRLFSSLKPQKGDLIFFDKINSKTHYYNIAIIEEVKAEQIKFIYSSNGVVKRGYLNNKNWKTHIKDKKIINSCLIKDKKSTRRLSSQFFRRFGSLFAR